ncbi:hypothetical protein GFM44_23390 [Rhizobium leguminosarum bv. viciae]|nr:hypothetical protein [Rhizobium leguminosarum bv. viciae]
MFDPITEKDGIHTSNAYRMNKRFEETSREETGRAAMYRASSSHVGVAIRLGERQLRDVLKIPESEWEGTVLRCSAPGPRWTGSYGSSAAVGQDFDLERRADGWWLIAIRRDKVWAGNRVGVVAALSSRAKTAMPDFENPPRNVIPWE